MPSAMMPTTNDRYYLASAWLCRGRWKNGHVPIFTVMAANSRTKPPSAPASMRMPSISASAPPSGVEKSALARIRLGARSQCATVYADGVVSHSTAGHGGFHLDAAHNAKVHPALRARGGWYEEDCAWAAVAQALPELFTDYERRCADQTIRDWYPDAWETIHGRQLLPGESHEKDRQAFERDHASDWIVISAIRSDHHRGMTECVATLGGDRRAAEQRRYLVPSDEYHIGRFGFVINEARHRLYGGPSNFVGWR